MKKLFVHSLAISTLSLLSTSALALSGHMHSGFYAGLQGTFLNSAVNYDDDTPAAGQVVNSQRTTVFRPGINVGYGNALADNNVYFGARMGGIFGGSKSTTVESGPEGDIYAKETGIFYADMVMGFLVNKRNGLLYTVIGMEHANFELTGLASESDANYGWRLGLGYGFALSDYVSMNFEVVYSGYSDVHFNKQGGGRYDLSPQSTAATVGISVNFNGDTDAGTPFLEDDDGE